jgi:hypothetical protein
MIYSAAFAQDRSGPCLDMQMANEDLQRVGIDQIMEAASSGVLRALEARQIDSPTFTRANGFFVNIQIVAGGYPGPVEKPTLGIEAPRVQ